MMLLVVVAGCADRGAGDDDGGPQVQTGTSETVFTSGDDPTNAFFQSLGTNGRACSTCHDRAAGWSVTPAGLQARFDATAGADPIFRTNDGSVSPGADVSTLAARRSAYALLLSRGLIRVGQGMPDNADFTVAVDDPYGFASAAELSLFRRPLPSTNLAFLSQIMWDSREPSLEQQATDATLGHANAASMDPAVAASIAAFESSTFTAERTDDVAGDLSSDGATGGADALVALNAAGGRGFSLYDAWTGADSSTAQGARRAAIARGQRVFDTKRFDIRGVAGLRDQDGTCSTCHDVPNVGNRREADPLDIGVSDPDRDDADLPRYTLTRVSDHRTVTTTDPGLALITGKLADAGRFKVPVLRGLAARAPYFHNGRAANLEDVVDFYRRRFDIRFDNGEEADLRAFLSAL